ncbi:MAG: winged helix-turn-helix transcriptional regulator [Patescibacteria group bacterium]
MPDNQNTTQNPISEENPIPASLQEPMADIPINITGSEPSNMPPEAPESPKNTDIPVSLNNDNPENTSVLTEKPEESKPAESASVEAESPKVEPISEPAQTSEPPTAQIPVDEPLNPEPEPLESVPISTPQPQPVPVPVFAELQQNKISLTRELLVKARNMIQFRKRKKLDRVMTLFLKHSKITNDEVREFLHVSDATATRYLSQLEQEGKIKQNGKTGHAVSYSRI